MSYNRHNRYQVLTNVLIKCQENSFERIKSDCVFKDWQTAKLSLCSGLSISNLKMMREIASKRRNVVI